MTTDVNGGSEGNGLLLNIRDYALGNLLSLFQKYALVVAQPIPLLMPGGLLLSVSMSGPPRLKYLKLTTSLPYLIPPIPSLTPYHITNIWQRSK